MNRLIAVLLLIANLCACGRTGELYLPEEAQPATEPEPVTAEPASAEPVTAEPVSAEQAEDEQADEEQNE